MKIKEVPQDGRRHLGKTLMLYAVNDKGNIEKVKSTGWDPGYQALDNIHDEFKEMAEQAKERIKNNQSSPLEYFMHLAIMDVESLAPFIGISKRIVKKHMTPQGFDKLDDEMLGRYADALLTDLETIKKFKSTLK